MKSCVSNWAVGNERKISSAKNGKTAGSSGEGFLYSFWWFPSGVAVRFQETRRVPCSHVKFTEKFSAAVPVQAQGDEPHKRAPVAECVYFARFRCQNSMGH